MTKPEYIFSWSNWLHGLMIGCFLMLAITSAVKVFTASQPESTILYEYRRHNNCLVVIIGTRDDVEISAMSESDGIFTRSYKSAKECDKAQEAVKNLLWPK